MNSSQLSSTKASTKQQAVVPKQPILTKIHPPEKKPLTFGQRVADKLASKVGSWTFLISQSTILAGWISFNLMPGVPHWDESPFILLNLVFSFASAYTAPVVLMSQNRQSEEDRENAKHNYQITLQAAQQLELLHAKLEVDCAKKLDDLTALLKQQPITHEVKMVFAPIQASNHSNLLFNSLPKSLIFSEEPKNLVFVNAQPSHVNAQPSHLTIKLTK